MVWIAYCWSLCTLFANSGYASSNWGKLKKKIWGGSNLTQIKQSLCDVHRKIYEWTITSFPYLLNIIHNTNVELDRQCMYKVALWRTRPNTVANKMLKCVLCVLLAACHCQQYENIERCKKKRFLWIIYASLGNKTCFCLQVQCLIVLYNAWYFCAESDVFVQCLIFLYRAWYFCIVPDIFVQCLIFLYTAWYFYTEPDIFVQSLIFLYSAWYFF